MNTSSRGLSDFHLFDPQAELRVVERQLPHWCQSNALCFITWRTVDSMPRQVVDAWHADRVRWLARHGIDGTKPQWRRELGRLDARDVREFLQAFWNRWHDALDACHGECVLRRAELAHIVADSLHSFNGDRYQLFDYVVMPNHVHILASFPDEEAMLRQCESWKHYMATKINRLLRRKGRFWQQDAFDHLLRSEEQFNYLRRYIAANPARGGLPTGSFVHYSKPIEIDVESGATQVHHAERDAYYVQRRRCQQRIRPRG
jgi:putative transposase